MYCYFIMSQNNLNMATMVYSEFQEELASCQQIMSFSSTDAHHQNVFAQRANQQNALWAKDILLHDIILRPKQTYLTCGPLNSHTSRFCGIPYLRLTVLLSISVLVQLTYSNTFATAMYLLALFVLRIQVYKMAAK